ncbi:hypothetical protein [Saccharibacillus sp. O23]|uniref:hypothetical protein n=1 Tax=Saccharibacillus sp. O23 TaxID=2009338 RepID=UPI0015C67221|nr:hypothetical protein [Saccharibacillus sp. O23]
MSERLSRMDRHPSTKKKRRKRQTFKQEWQENQRRLSDTTVLRLSVPENRSVLSEPELSPPTVSESVSAGYRTEPRREAPLRTVSATEAEQEQEEGEELPPRSVLYPSGRIRLTKWFYETLILLFLILLGTLLWWGTQTTGVKWPWQ